ncbi:MAG: hypothetical protein K2X11_17805, partial [Acetobacteraceae bacterium]|nr:hypothetical protein [Acetobacteraceae bacterium]
MVPGLTPGLAAPLAVAAGALLLLWPALLNGHPILARGSAEGPVPPWPWVASQALAFSALAWLFARLPGRATPRRHVGLCAALALVTPAAWVASLAATDALVPIAALAAAL